MNLQNHIYIIGAGLFGIVIAERLAAHGIECSIIEKSNHIGGNCASFLDKSTGIEVHRYGSHIFHTSNERVWKYINRFTTFNDYTHHVLVNTCGQIYPLPISLATINAFFKKAFSPQEAQFFLRSTLPFDSIPKNLEEKAISLVGNELYCAFIKGYTQKQWGKDPSLLPEEIITRLPLRFNYNTRYFSDKFEGIPIDGYDNLFKKMLSNPLIKIQLECDYSDIKTELPDALTIFTGPIDEFFDYKFGKLEYRYVDFAFKTLEITDYQGNSVINYADLQVPYTRIHEFKHYHPEKKYGDKTIICQEFSKGDNEGGRMAYPVRTTQNLNTYKKYEQLAIQNPFVIFGGRLGSYQYWDMDDTIDAALTYSDKIIKQFF